MNPDQPSRDEIEVKLTALLLGELPADEAKLLRWAIAQDAGLKQLHDRLKLTIGLVREVASKTAGPETEKTDGLKLSESRRGKLLAQLQTPSPKPLFWLKRIEMPRLPALLPALAVLAIIGLFAAIALPNFVKARSTSKSNAIINNLRMLDAAKQQWALEQNKPAEAAPTMEDLKPYLAKNGAKAVAGEKYILGKVSESPVADLAGSLDKKLAFGGQPRQLRLDTDGTGGGNVAVASVATPPPSVVPPAPEPTLAPSPETPRVITVAPDPILAPPPPSIVLPSTEPVAGAVAITGSLNNEGTIWEASSFNRGDYAAAPVPTPATPSSSLAGSSTISFGSGLALPPTSFGRAVQNAPGDSDGGNATFDKSGRTGGSGGGGAGGEMALGIESRLFVTNSASLGLNWSGTDQKRAEDQPQNTGHGFSPAGPNGNKGDAAQASGDSLVSSGLREQTLPAGQAQVLAKSETTPVSGRSVYGYVSGASQAYRPGTSAVTLEDGSPIESVRRREVKKPAAAPAPVPIQNSATVAVNAFADAGNLQAEPTPSLDAAAVPVLTPQNFARQEDYAQAPQNGLSRTTRSAGDYSLVRKAPATVDEFKGRLEDRAPGEVASLESTMVRKKAKLAVTTPSDNEATQVEKDVVTPRAPADAPVPQPEILTRENAFSTFSLNVSDVSFKLAAASLEKGQLPEAAGIRSEEFINAFDYRDPEAAAGEPIAFASERARYPFAQNRDLLRFSVKTAAAGRPAGRALNLVLLLDNSGSMERADRVQIIRAALAVLTTQLQPQDTVSVVTFARTARLWLDGVSGAEAGAALEKIGDLTPQGGTNLEEAMRLAYETARRHYHAGGLNRVVMLTDGAANLGNVDAGALTEKVEANRQQGIALDCFGIGWEGLNDDLLEQLTRHGDGRYAFINTPEDATKEFAAKLAGALQIAAADVKVQVEFNPQRVVSYRQIGYAKHQLTKEQFRDNTVDAAEIAAQEAGNALYTVETKPDGSGPVATVRVRYKVPGTTDYRERSWDVPYTGNAVALAQASPALRLAATASAFSEWLAASPFAQEISPADLTQFMAGVPEFYGADERPKQLVLMLLQAKSLAGK